MPPDLTSRLSLLIVVEMADAPFDLSVKRYLPRVKDFERDEKGEINWSSLQGPERIEVRLVALRAGSPGAHV